MGSHKENSGRVHWGFEQDDETEMDQTDSGNGREGVQGEQGLPQCLVYLGLISTCKRCGTRASIRIDGVEVDNSPNEEGYDDDIRHDERLKVPKLSHSTQPME